MLATSRFQNLGHPVGVRNWRNGAASRAADVTWRWLFDCNSMSE